MLKNPLQSFWDWANGRWTCPECGTTWHCPTLFSDCTCVTVENGEVVERRLECPECGFKRECHVK